jgi:hypothetical protein
LHPHAEPADVEILAVIAATRVTDDGNTLLFGHTRSPCSRGIIEILAGYLPSVKLLADPAWSPGRSNAKWQNVTTAGVDKEEPLKPEGGPLNPGNVAAVNDLLDAIEQNREPKCGALDARASMEMILAAFESHRVGGPVKEPQTSAGDARVRFIAVPYCHEVNSPRLHFATTTGGEGSCCGDLSSHSEVYAFKSPRLINRGGATTRRLTS